jgi:hypothetical protein
MPKITKYLSRRYKALELWSQAFAVVEAIAAGRNVMNLLTVIVIGAVLGGLDGVGIFFEPKEPYKWEILLAATLKGALVALLTGFSVAATTRWWSAMAGGALYGLAFSLVVYLAKGGPKSGDAPYVVPSGIITGGLIGLFIVIWAVR